MFFLRLTLYTCTFYLAIALPFILTESAMERWGGGFGIHFTRSGFLVIVGFWGIAWLASFLLAFRIVFGAKMWNWIFA
jgi:hypothetical protein